MTGNAFEDAIADPSRAIILDADSEGDVLVIAFGGIAKSLDGIPPFEFLSVLDGRPVRRVFVRDVRQAWYQAGLPGGEGTSADFVRGLREVVTDRPPRRIVTIGVSAGGFAAIAFGCELGADVALAFSPQTFTGRWARRIHRETRWPEETVNVDRLDQALVCRDLRPVIGSAAHRHPETRIEIHVGRHRGDLRHVRRIERLPNVTVVEHDAAHNVARVLRDDGSLETIITDVLGPLPG